jgi:TonB-linked SusC/RagA family outer membrane protein
MKLAAFAREMYFPYSRRAHPPGNDAFNKAFPWSKLWLIMRLTTIVLLVTALHVSAGVYSQKVTISVKATPLEKVLNQIKKQTGYSFFWSDQLIAQAPAVSVRLKDATLTQALDACLRGLPLVYEIREQERFVYIKPAAIKPPVVTEQLPAPKKDSTWTITGRVTDEQGLPLGGASIRVKGSNTAVSCDAKGYFKLTTRPAHTILVISFVGYKDGEQLVSGSTSLAITLSPGNSELDQIQVIGYGSMTTAKRLNTGDVTTITAEEIRKNPVNNVLEAIQGKVPGLFIQQVTGQPGGAFTMRLRSAANFSAGAPAPLVVVDGVMYPGGTLPLSSNTSYGTANFLKGGSGLNYINPNDIESISVLKDADATALYGTSGAYGVVLITTKKAKQGTPPSLNANIYTGISVLGATAKLMNTQEYLMLRREALKNDGATAGPLDKDLNGTWPEDRYQDFREDLLGSNAQTTNASLTYNGGSQNTGYMISGSLRNNGNIQRHKGASTDGTIRFSLNSNTNDNKFSISLSGAYLSSKSNMVPMDFSTDVTLAAPNSPSLFLPDGNINWSEGANDVADDINKQYENVTNNLLGNGSLVYKPIKQLTLRADVSYNEMAGREFMGYPTTTKPPTYTNAALETHSLVHTYNVRTISVSPYAAYSMKVFGKGDLNMTLGGRVDNKLSTFNEIHGEGFASDALLRNPAVGSKVTTSYGSTPYRSLGAYAIVKFIWDQKYIVNLNGRRDGSTKFGDGKKFGNFGSVALAWIFSEESFFRKLAPFISFGKLRGSTGLIGGDAVGDFAYLSIYQALTGTYQNKSGLAIGRLANPALSWEKNRNSEAGIELGFFNDRVFAEVSAYRNIATNQLIGQPMPSVTGVTSMPVNSDATIRTSGWEMSLSATAIKTKDFSWTVRGNISIPKSKLVKLPVSTTLAANYVLNKPVTGVLLYKYEGINPQTGYYRFTAANGTTDDYMFGLDEQKDKTEFLDLAPTFYGAFQNGFRYKRLSLDLTFNFTKRVGKNIMAQQPLPFGYMGINGGTYWLNRWQKPGDITDVPRISTSVFDWFRHFYYQESTGAYSDASYVRLQNVSIRYSVNPQSLRKLGVKDLSIYLQGQNLLTISDYGGLDPENLDAATIPPMRVFTAGINLTF